MAVVSSCPAQPWDTARGGLGSAMREEGSGARAGGMRGSCQLSTQPASLSHLLEAVKFFNRCQRHTGRAGSAKFVLPALCLFHGQTAE